jgi:DNA topoisomerase-3
MKHKVAVCPHCGANVVEFSKFYGCENWKSIDGGCPFTLPKYFIGKSIQPHIIRELVNNRCSRVLDGFVSKKGNEFSASLLLVFDNHKWKLKIRFSE